MALPMRHTLCNRDHHQSPGAVLARVVDAPFCDLTTRAIALCVSVWERVAGVRHQLPVEAPISGLLQVDGSKVGEHLLAPYHYL